MKKRVAISLLIAILILMMACTISYEGVAIGDDPDVSKIEDQTATAEGRLLPVPEEPQNTPQPTQPPVQSNPPEAVSSAGLKEYAVAATNFDCVCQVDGNVKVEFTLKGDQLEMTNPAGGVDVYDKIAENAYKRSWMGYYILASGEGENMTETRIDEERSVVIILNDTGYVMEHYQGTNSSPCCFHTFTKTE